MTDRITLLFRRSTLLWIALAAAASVFAYYNLFSWYPAVIRYGVDFHRAFTWELLKWNLWLPLTAAILSWCRRPSWRRYGLTATVAPAIHTTLLVLVNFILWPTGILAMLRHRAYILVPDYFTGIIISSLVLGVAYLRDREPRAARLETQLAQAQLDALKMQLQPHFLFNTLNAVSALQMEDPEAAQRMIVRLADFLRMTMDHSCMQEVRLDREMDFLTSYLEIERVRFPDKLSVDIAVEPETRQALVPNLILQPIVENAIRHGISKQVALGRVAIHASRRNGSLLLQVSDTGPGTAGAPKCEGRGLRITRSRLDGLYGQAAKLSAGNAAGGGFEVAIEIPFSRSCG